MAQGKRNGSINFAFGNGQGMEARRGQWRGRMGWFGMGPDGNCVCPNCGATVPHQRGIPCNTIKCPSCGAMMSRQ